MSVARILLRTIPWLCAGAVLLWADHVARATNSTRPPDSTWPTTFDTGIARVFRRHCVRCHGPREMSGGLRLDSYQDVMRGGEQGPAIIAGDLNASLLFQKVLRLDEPAMPPRQRLPPRDVAKLRAWIEAGALP